MGVYWYGLCKQRGGEVKNCKDDMFMNISKRLFLTYYLKQSVALKLIFYNFCHLYQMKLCLTAKFAWTHTVKLIHSMQSKNGLLLSTCQSTETLQNKLSNQKVLQAEQKVGIYRLNQRLKTS